MFPTTLHWRMRDANQSQTTRSSGSSTNFAATPVVPLTKCRQIESGAHHSLRVPSFMAHGFLCSTLTPGIVRFDAAYQDPPQSPR